MLLGSSAEQKHKKRGRDANADQQHPRYPQCHHKGQMPALVALHIQVSCPVAEPPVHLQRACQFEAMQSERN
jgi:hypothetical protein